MARITPEERTALENELIALRATAILTKRNGERLKAQGKDTSVNEMAQIFIDARIKEVEERLQQP